MGCAKQATSRATRMRGPAFVAAAALLAAACSSGGNSSDASGESADAVVAAQEDRRADTEIIQPGELPPPPGPRDLGSADPVPDTASTLSGQHALVEPGLHLVTTTGVPIALDFGPGVGGARERASAHRAYRR